MTVLGPKSLFSTKSTPLNPRESGNMFKTAAYRWQGRQVAVAVCLLFVAQCDCGSSDCLALSLLKTDKPTHTSGLPSQGSRSSTLATSKRFVPPILTARSMPCRSRVPPFSTNERSSKWLVRVYQFPGCQVKPALRVFRINYAWYKLCTCKKVAWMSIVFLPTPCRLTIPGLWAVGCVVAEEEKTDELHVPRAEIQRLVSAHPWGSLSTWRSLRLSVDQPRSPGIFRSSRFNAHRDAIVGTDEHRSRPLWDQPFSA